MEKEKDHDSFTNSMATDTDGQSGGAEDEDKNEAREGVGDRKIERTGEESGARKAEKVYADGDENDGNSAPATVHGVSQATKKIEEDSAAGEFLGQGKVGKKSRDNETEKKEKRTEGAEPRKSGGEGGEGRVSAESIGGARKKKKGEAKEGGYAENTIEENGKCGPSLLMGKPAEKIKKANGVSSGRADQKKIKKEAHESQMNRAEVGQRNLL
jgi:hypothetical protein